MKKIISIIFTLALLTALFTVTASAGTFNPNGYCDIETTIKKADPSNVIKDGVIGNGEYERLIVDVTEDNTSLDINYVSNVMYDRAVQLLGSMEYYFSWDEVHGLNFAVRCRPVDNFQKLKAGYGNPPGDDFLENTGFQFASDPTVTRGRGETWFFYYAVAKSTETGEYLKGHCDQLGYTGNYDPEPGKDFCINYENGGTVLLEWSIPFDVFAKGAEAGSEVYFSITTTGGDATQEQVDMKEWQENVYSISLGDWGWLVKQVPNESHHLIALLSAEAVSGTNQGGGNNETGDNGGGNGSNVTAVETYLTTDAEGNTVVETRVVEKNVTNNGTNNTNAGKRTGDPMIIIAAVSAVSACGVVVFKKKH